MTDEGGVNPATGARSFHLAKVNNIFTPATPFLGIGLCIPYVRPSSIPCDVPEIKNPVPGEGINSGL